MPAGAHEDGRVRIFRGRYETTAERHRTTSFEIFFDLVFVFALTRIVEFMEDEPSAVTLTRGLLLFLLLWFSWSSYAWLGNQVRADVGLVRTGTLAAMAAMFVAALAIPGAWRGSGPVPTALVLAASYMAVRTLHLALFLAVSRDRQLTRTLRLTAIPVVLGWIPLVTGALVGGATQTVLWTVAFAVDVGGARIASGFGPWPLRSVSHFTERHRLVLIIAVGESLISIGIGAGAELRGWLVLLAALLGFAAAASLWRLYFDRFASVIERSLEGASAARRATIASDAYSLAHFPMVAGIMYVAFGIEQVLATLIHEPDAHQRPLGLPGTVALYAGGALYLVGRALCLRLATMHATLAPLAGAAVLLLLIAPARLLPAVVALALLVLALVAQLAVEWRWPRPAAPLPANQPAG